MMSEEWSDIAINEKVAVNICWLFPLEKNCICEKEMKQFYSSLKPHQGAKILLKMKKLSYKLADGWRFKIKL